MHKDAITWVELNGQFSNQSIYVLLSDIKGLTKLTNKDAITWVELIGQLSNQSI